MVYFLVVIVVILADQFTKALIVTGFHLYEVREIVSGFFNLVYVTNSGAAFSILAGVNAPWRHWFFLGVGGVAFCGITFAYFRLRRTSRYYALPFAFIAGGAVGNLIDRVRYGAVVDFLDFYLGRYHWPAFNVADSCICAGAFLFMLFNLMGLYGDNKEQSQK